MELSPPESVTVTVLLPAGKSIAGLDVLPFDQRYIYGVVPPVTLTSAVPLASPLQFGSALFIRVTVGGVGTEFNVAEMLLETTLSLALPEPLPITPLVYRVTTSPAGPDGAVQSTVQDNGLPKKLFPLCSWYDLPPESIILDMLEGFAMLPALPLLPLIATHWNPPLLATPFGLVRVMVIG